MRLLWNAGHLIASVMLVVGLYNFFGGFGINTSRPDPSTGRVYELNNHGQFAYVTRTEYWRSEGLMFGGLGLNRGFAMLRLRVSGSNNSAA
jgi:hypothetical protein